ncbi:MAG: Gfo/Idh/MocA family oxidoreductase [Rhodobiaceae bacterium]|nr:Gfo/Idh/MocA family oxidoreductase [Rhodobiaceae bacterium]
MKDRPDIQIGLVGCGNWGRHILRDLKAGGASVTVVARSKASTDRARDGGATAVVASIERLPGDLDGFVVATPTETHLPVVEKLLARQKPIFVEKPLGNDVARAGQLPAAAGNLVFTMQKWRYHPGIQAIATMAQEREFGPIRAIRSMRLGWGNPHAGVDTIWHLLPHDLAIALQIFGDLLPLLSVVPDALDARETD